jgi:hypothetical protein
MYQRGINGQSIPASGYPAIPEATEFFTGWKYEKPITLHYWCWRTDYQAWGAFVAFADGLQTVTNPKPA